MIGRIVKPWPGMHGGEVHQRASKHATRNGIAPGALIEVDGPWEPNSSWTCNTDVVWRVADSRVPFANVYLCVHQISFEPSAIETETAVTSDQVQAVSQ
jgi:hypothetical protein